VKNKREIYNTYLNNLYINIKTIYLAIYLFIIFENNYKKISNKGNRITKINTIITIILIIAHKRRKSQVYYLVFNIIIILLQFNYIP